MRAPSPARAFALAAIVTALGACSAAAPSAPTSDVFAAAPWTGAERMEYRLVNNDGEVFGSGVFTTEPDGGGVLLTQDFEEADPPPGVTPTKDVVTVRVDAATLRPIAGEREIVRRDADGAVTQERYSWTYDGGAEGRLTVTHTTGGRSEEAGLALRAHAYDNEASLWLWRTIAFAEGYDEAYVSVDPIRDSQQTVSLRIPQTESVEVPAGTFQAWRLLLRNGRAVRTAWVNMAPPHEVLRWDNGETIFELVSYAAD